MPKKLLLFIVFISTTLFGQNATEIYLFDLIQNDSVFTIKNPVNISNNKGYDNQPSFLNDGTGILYTSTRTGQTDIILYNLENQTQAWLTDTEESEYSPIQTPNRRYFTAVSVAKDSTQSLWKYHFNRKKKSVILNDLKVGYYAWYNKKTVVSFILGDPPTLKVSNLKYKIHYPIHKNIGRSIHKIPNQNLISFISLEQKEPEIYSINPINSKKEFIADALEGSQDMAWTPDGTIIMGKDDTLFMLKPGVDTTWVEFTSLKYYKLTGISRIAISPLGNKIAIVINENNLKE